MIWFLRGTLLLLLFSSDSMACRKDRVWLGRYFSNGIGFRSWGGMGQGLVRMTRGSTLVESLNHSY
ncbi:hypothetical protein M378DRAFT_162087 [Amanita muscaria Koide BX008]|uniref:Secreted protein n=1 Tax=Amanita muscaria (strain Koide BX008) TaxID=946122 RepID=A0A0C2SQC4_AMAMK|nr:hypothetical protein M378DRAFT_162087 [Amanita muscaria Koide BX008]